MALIPMEYEGGVLYRKYFFDSTHPSIGAQNTWDKTLEVAKREDNPKMYFSCGTKDFVMYKHFVKFREYAEKAGLDAEFIEIEGFDHEWRFWDLCVQDAIEKFLPGDEKAGNAF
jgi:S-formylglutathione hydrolase FrmB